MGHPRKKIYKAGSPGWVRQQNGITLSAMKRVIKVDRALRRDYKDRGILG
jgi:hypothetical protein